MNKIIEKLKTVKPRYYLAALLIVVIAIIGVIVFKPSYSVESNLLDNATLDGITITDISLVEDNGVATYQATVTATRNISVNYVEIILTTEKGTVTLVGYVGKTLANGETSIIKASTDADIMHATDINYIMK